MSVTTDLGTAEKFAGLNGRVFDAYIPRNQLIKQTGIWYKNQVLNAGQAAYLVRNSPQYVGGNQKVILYACDNGKASNGFAKQLADSLGVVVEAPNRKLFPTLTGEFVIADEISWLENTYIRGSWI